MILLSPFVHLSNRVGLSHTRGHTALLLFSVFGGGALSCSGDTLNGPPPLSAAQAYWALQVNYHAINMATIAPYNTVQLTAIPLNAAGTPIVGLGVVSYTAADTTVTVSPTGLLTARYVTSAGYTQVIATLQDTVQRVTHVDTVNIQVTDTVPQHPLATFSMQPAQGDSAKRSVNFQSGNGGIFSAGQAQFPWPVTAVTTAKDTVCDTVSCPLQVHYTSSNPTVATIDGATGQVSGRGIGHTVFTATTLYYGMILRDSVDFTIGYLPYYTIREVINNASSVPTLDFTAPKKLVLGVGAVVYFLCIPDDFCHQADVAFDSPIGVDTASVVSSVFSVIVPPTGSGNISTFGGDTLDFQDLGSYFIADYRARRFSRAGTYRYHSTRYPSDTNEIVIQQGP